MKERPNLDEVITDIQKMIDENQRSYIRYIHVGTLMDILYLLKEKKQEAVEPKLVGVNTWICGKCEALLGWEDFTPSGVELVEYKFCPECGKKVKWE